MVTIKDRNYVVVCRDEGKWYLATRQLFTVEEATKYMKPIPPSRTPVAVDLEQFVRSLPPTIELPGFTFGGVDIKGPMLKVGDVVWCFNKSEKAVVTHIEVNCRDKEGDEVDEVPWLEVDGPSVIVSLDNGHWNYGDQISRVSEGD